MRNGSHVPSESTSGAGAPMPEVGDGESRRGAALDDGSGAGAPADAGADESTAVDSIRVLVICVLGWAMPGFGHIAAGRVGRGVLFGLVVLSLFFAGIALDGKVYRPEEGRPLTYLAAVGGAGVGLPYVMAHAAGSGGGDLRSGSYEYGNTFTLLAGLLNLLIVLDAYDVATGRR